MLGIFEKIFGGSEGTQQSSSSSNSTSTSAPIDVNDPAFKGLRNPLAGALEDQLTQGGPTYTGPLNAPIGGNEQGILSSLMSQTGLGTNRSSYLDKVLQGNFLPGEPQQNPFLQAAITAAQRPTMENLTEILSRTLPGRFTQAGQMVQPQGSSAFDRAAAIASRGASQTMGDIATNMSMGAYNTERNAQQQSVGLSQQEVQASVQNLQTQALPRMIQELGIERGLQLFQQKTSSLLDILKTIAGVSAPVIGNQAQAQSQSQSQGMAKTQSTPGVLAGLKGLVGGGGGGSPVSTAATGA